MTKKIFLLTAAIVLTAATASASAKWTLQSKEYTVDTLYHAKIGPGTTQTSLVLKGSNTLKVFYTTTDLTHPYVDIRVAQAGPRLTGGAKLSAMSNANTDATTGIEYFAGVNADFFGNSQPVGSAVVNGETYKAINSSWISWYMNDKKVPGIEKLSFSGTVTAGDGSSHAVSSINYARETDNLVIYNSHFGDNTGTNAYGTEVVIRPVEGSIGYNNKTTCRVDGAPVASVGKMAIPADAYVLSGHGTASAFVGSIKDGDLITVDLTTQLATGGTVAQMAGGQPMILQNGETLETQGVLDHLTALNPRTAVGYSADRTRLVLLVVDGRNSGGSAGVVSKTLADIMRCVGCADAMNFDGGGSSELYTRAFGVRNKPSDGNERTVVNSVWAVYTGPADETVAELSFGSETITLPKYGYYVPTFYAYNKYGKLLSTDFTGAVLSCDPELGKIVEDGTTLYANGSGTHKLTATYGDVSATITVTIGNAAPKMRLENVIVDSYHDYKAEVTATVNDIDMKIDNQALTWSSSDPDIVTVDEQGLIHGVKNGNAVVTATVDNFVGTLPVTVEKPDKRYRDIPAGTVDADWATSQTSIKNAKVTKLGENGLATDYTTSSTRGTQISVKSVNPMALYSLPDSIRVVVNPGESKITKVVLNAAKKGERPLKVEQSPTLTPNANNVLTYAVSDIIDTKDFASYPVELTSIQFYIGDAVGFKGHIEIPEFQTVYTAIAPGDNAVENITFDGATTDATPLLSVGAVQRGTIVELNAPADIAWTAYTNAGATVAQGRSNLIDTAVLAPGLYIIAADNRAARLLVK